MSNVVVPKENGSTNIPETSELSRGFADAYRLVDDVVLKNYITRLPEFSVIPLNSESLSNNLSKIRLFKITEMVYERDESATYKFASVFNAVATTNSAIITVIDSDGEKTDFYLGIRSLSDENSTQTSYSALVNAIQGQFPGIKTENLKNDQIKDLLESIDTDSLSSVSCVANNKNEDFTDNDNYLQGLEKLALAMQGNRYTAVVVANSTSQEQLDMVRKGYETIYTQMSPFASSVVNYGDNQSKTVNITETIGENEGEATAENKSITYSEGKTKNTGEVKNVQKKTLKGKVGSAAGSAIGATLTAAGALVGSTFPGAGTVIGAAVGGAVGGVIRTAISIATDETESITSGGGNVNSSYSEVNGSSYTINRGTSHSVAESLGLTTGETKNIQLTVQNKSLIDMLNRIDRQIERLDEFESVGMWECAAYFMSEDSSVSEVAAATYKALMSGENTGLEVSAINTWTKPQDSGSEGKSQNELIAEYVKNFIHPVFEYTIAGNSIPVTPTNLVSGNELAIHMGLPRNSVCGFPVIEHADFGKEVVKYDKKSETASIKLGSIFNMGRAVDTSKVSLDIESLAMHTFIVGSTGSGKSNTVYHILNELISTRRDELSFMVIEPAKGEYKKVWGHKKDVHVLGTNPEYMELLRINPFKFPKNTHVLEHVDRLIEIFNVCWPMYAAMPAVLKDAVIEAYEACGWDITTSKNLISDALFPSFQDLQEQLISVIDSSGYSEEVKSNYKGSLLTRIKSLTNGLNGMIFSSNEINNEMLFDTNVIIDLSRVGSQETKSLIMGILVMRLSEYRMDTCVKSNCKLKHITVLEEAHNILRNTSVAASGEEGGNVAGKSVEMLSNAIAEMRTYGEGFIIADQSPGAVDISAIRNTNTKIIMRLPEESDRRLSGKAAALRDNQLDEIAKLPKGVAVVYQNDWVEPVLCQIEKFGGEEEEYTYNPKKQRDETKIVNSVLINFIAHNRLDNPDLIISLDVDRAIEKSECSVRTKAKLYSLLSEYKRTHRLEIWKEERFAEQSDLIRDTLRLENAVEYSRRVSSNLVEFNCYLNTLISQRLNKPSDDLILSLSHCLIKSYSQNEERNVEFYKEWHDELTERGNLL